MQWLDTTLIEPVWQQVSATAPTNPSSLTLALIGAGMLVLFGMGRRTRPRQKPALRDISPNDRHSEERRAA